VDAPPGWTFLEGTGLQGNHVERLVCEPVGACKKFGLLGVLYIAVFLAFLD
jgi:hypothetical protein